MKENPFTPDKPELTLEELIEFESERVRLCEKALTKMPPLDFVWKQHLVYHGSILAMLKELQKRRLSGSVVSPFDDAYWNLITDLTETRHLREDDRDSSPVQIEFAELETLVDATWASIGRSLEAYLLRQMGWSEEVFGEGLRTKGITAHIRKELEEIEAKPTDLEEWVDVIILALDGYWRHGGNPAHIMTHLQRKQDKNVARKWPKPVSEDLPVEHDRTGEVAP